MSTDRRSFLERMAMGAIAIPAMDALRPASTRFDTVPAVADWDLSWTGKLKSPNRAIFDVPEVEQGYGVWRAIGTRRQYQDVLKKPLDMVLVLRHNGIALAMNQAFWEKYNVGTDK